MIDSDFRPPGARNNVRPPTVAYVPNELGGKYAGYLYVLASAEGPVLSVPGIIGGIDDSVRFNPRSCCARHEYTVSKSGARSSIRKSSRANRSA